MKKIKTLLSVILSAVMIFGVMPFASAAVRTVEEVLIYDYEYPLVKTTPSDTPKIGIPDGADYILDDFCWVHDSTKEEVGADEPFEAGRRYSLMIRILPEENCEFSRDVSINISGDIDQGEILVRPYEILIYTPPVKPCVERISEVVIKNFKTPEPGQRFSYSMLPAAPNGAHYTLSCSWSYTAGGGYIYTGDQFVSGEAYTFVAAVEPEENYCFSSHVTITVEGGDMTVDEGASIIKKNAMELHSKPFIIGSDDAELIEVAEVFGVSAPVIGQSAAENMASISVSGNCVAADIGWNRDTDEYVEEYECFSSGGTYYMYFCLVAAEGYAFDPLSLPEVRINGGSDLVISEYTYYAHIDGRLTVVFFSQMMEAIADPGNTLITLVNINGFEVPTVGETADENLALLTADADANYTFRAQWRCTCGGDFAVDGGSVFEDGKTYYLSLSVTADYSHHFDRNSLPTVLLNGSDQYIDGDYTRYYENEGILVCFTTDLTPQAAPAVTEAITSVTVSGYRVPSVGETAGKNLETLTADESEKYDFVYALWHNVTDDAYMTDSDKFEANKTYRLEFRFRAEEGFFFDPDALPVITVNGETNLVKNSFTYTDSDHLQLTFYVYCAAPTFYGDCNGDGKINGQDLIRLRKFLNGESVALFAGADVTGNGSINGQDLVRLRKYLNGEDAVLGPST